jgi:hypothetical protein
LPSFSCESFTASDPRLATACDSFRGERASARIGGFDSTNYVTWRMCGVDPPDRVLNESTADTFRARTRPPSFAVCDADKPSSLSLSFISS